MAVSSSKGCCPDVMDLRILHSWYFHFGLGERSDAVNGLCACAPREHTSIGVADQMTLLLACDVGWNYRVSPYRTPSRCKHQGTVDTLPDSNLLGSVLVPLVFGSV